MVTWTCGTVAFGRQIEGMNGHDPSLAVTFSTLDVWVAYRQPSGPTAAKSPRLPPVTMLWKVGLAVCGLSISTMNPLFEFTAIDSPVSPWGGGRRAMPSFPARAEFWIRVRTVPGDDALVPAMMTTCWQQVEPYSV